MDNFKDYCITVETSIQDLAAKLNSSKIKTLFVIDDQCKLIGSVTDGDLRRGVMKSLSTDATVMSVMNNNPKFLRMEKDEPFYKKNEDLVTFNALPVVLETMEIVDIVSLEDMNQEIRFENTVLIMAGGFGKRLMPLTEKKPKPMLTLGSKPILEHIIDNFSGQGFKNFEISVHYKAEQIINHFGNGRHKDVCINYLQEKEPMGTAGCLSLLDKQKVNCPMIVTNGDIITSTNYSALLEFHTQNKADITMGVRTFPVSIPFGVVEIKDCFVSGLREKPIYEHTINAGIYVLSEKVLNICETSRIDITDIISNCIRSGSRVCAYPIVEEWSDIGRHDDLRLARQSFIA